MSLYHEAASILAAANNASGSLKSHIFSSSSSSKKSSSYKSDPKLLFALTTETVKFSQILSEVITHSKILQAEKTLASASPYLSLVLVHDLLFAKRGIVLPAQHGLANCVLRHKARLHAELTKARIRRGVGDVEGLRRLVNSQAAEGRGGRGKHVRWVRVNRLKAMVEEELETTFKEFERVGNLKKVLEVEAGRSVVHVDEHVPDLLAVPLSVDLTATKAYKTGRLILQDKASCFPAYLLDPRDGEGDIIDACAAPGNKTTHLAAMLGRDAKNRITACEKDVLRSQTLSKMVKTAGGDDIITVKQKQDFMKLDPGHFASVTSLLLDPSCSGSGIVGRDEETVTVHLPITTFEDTTKSKKRKREPEKPQPKVDTTAEEEVPITAENEEKLQARLQALSGFQLRLLERAMSFPSARRITYSTCSVHVQENENVVIRALVSEVGRSRGWRVLKRDEQVDGMKKWHVRGWQDACNDLVKELNLADEIKVETVAQACIRCEKGSQDGTMGFFVAAFTRDDNQPETKRNQPGINGHNNHEEDEWNGFED